MDQFSEDAHVPTEGRAIRHSVEKHPDSKLESTAHGGLAEPMHRGEVVGSQNNKHFQGANRVSSKTP